MLKKLVNKKINGDSNAAAEADDALSTKRKLALHKALGGDTGVESFVQNFYERVWGDDVRWFAESFSRIVSIDHAIWAQTAFWVSNLTGRPTYHGGDFRTQFHHNRARHVMNERGGIRWLFILEQALHSHCGHKLGLFGLERKEEKKKRGLQSVTPVPVPSPRKGKKHKLSPGEIETLEAFLRYTMNKYGHQFGFDAAMVMAEPDAQEYEKLEADKEIELAKAGSVDDCSSDSYDKELL